MRRYVLLLVIFPLILGFNRINAGVTGPVDTVISYFEACKNGDIETMKGLIAGHFYANKKVLLSKNKDYPEYLKNYYQDLHITILASEIGNFETVAKNHPKLYERYQQKKALKKVDAIDGFAVVMVSFEFPDKSAFNTKLLLKKDAADNWKIYEQLLNY